MRKLLIAAAALLMNISAAYAQTPEAARQYVDTVGRQVLGIVNGQDAETARQQQLRQLFTQNVDMEWMGRFVLGPAWAQANEDQRARYMDAYRNYLLARYTRNFSDYAGSQYVVTGVKNEGEGQYTVGMKVNSPNASEKETIAGYRLRPEGEAFKIVDIIVEGVSLITTQRSEFAAVVQRNGMDGLIRQLQSKTRA